MQFTLHHDVLPKPAKREGLMSEMSLRVIF